MNYMRKFCKQYKLNTVPFFLFYMLVCFPFVGGNIINSDTQPWALMMAIIIVTYYWLVKRVWYRNVYTNVLLLFLLYCMIIGLLSIPNMTSISSLIRSGANYATVFFVTLATYYMMKSQGGLKENWIKIITWIWFLVGFVQKYIYSEFGYMLLTHTRTRENRGVIALASEPSFYGYMCIFLAVLALEFNRNRALYLILNLVQIVVFAGSAVSAVYLIIFAITYILTSVANGERRGYFAFVSLTAIGVFLYEEIPWIKDRFQNRIFQILYNVCYNREALFQDNSVTSRLDDIVNSFKGLIEWWGFPHGFSSTRIMSGYGAMAYELGIVGIIMVLLFLAIMINGKKDIFVAISVTIMLFSAVQLANPLFSFYIGYCLYKKSIRNQMIEGDSRNGQRDTD